MNGGEATPLGARSDILVLGHSHIAALVQAMRQHGVDLRHQNLWLFSPSVRYAEGRAALTPELDAIAGRTVVSVVGGSAHDLIGLGRHPQPFDFVLPDAPELPLIPGAELIPAAAMARALRGQIEDKTLDVVRLLAESGRRVVHLEPPPPVGDDPRLARELDLMGFVGDPARGPSPPWLRLKLWRLHSRIVGEVYEAAGVEVRACPPESQDPDGFLRPEFYAYPCHANAAYGALVLRQLGLIA